jgi:WD40 repeat protein/tRNA A-37 threonylcarbamoyl transferase component Bud32
MSWLDRLLKNDGPRGGAQKRTPPDVLSLATLQKPQGRGTVLRGDVQDAVAAALAQPALIPTLPDFSEGARIADYYTIRRRLGGGAMGTVYLARHEQWDLEVVLKVPNNEILADPENRHRITREAEVWTDLGLHPHIAYCYHVRFLGEIPVLVIEYLDGGNLRDWITEGRCADLKVGLDIAIQFCHALERAHAKGVVHRDIKPENVLLAQDGTLKLTDFGIARAARVGDLKAASSAAVVSGRTVGSIGTYEYMAPEQFESAHEVDHRADIFAFGVCLYEMFCGSRPYQIAAGQRQEAPEPHRFRGDHALPPKLCDLLKACVDWVPTQRPTTVAAIRSELCGLYGDLFQRSSPHANLPSVALEADGWNNRGLSYLELQRQDDALRSFDAALGLNPQHVEATYNKALLQWRRAEIDDDSALYRLQLLSSAPDVDEKELAISRAKIFLERFDAKAAQDVLRSYSGLYEHLHSARQPSDIGCTRTLQQNGFISAVAITPDSRLALVAHDSLITVWNLRTGRARRSLSGHAEGVKSVAITPDGTHGISLSDHGTLKLWNLTFGVCLLTLIPKHRSYGLTSPVALSADGRRCVWGSMMEVLDLNYVGPFAWIHHLRKLYFSSTSALSVAMTPDGRLAVVGKDSGLETWDLETGTVVKSFLGPSCRLIAMTPDGRFVITAGDDTAITLWDVNTGECLRTLVGFLKSVNSLAISRDGRRALTAGDSSIKVWDLRTGRCLRTFDCFAASVWIGPDGLRGFSGGGNHLNHWNLDFGHPAAQAFSPSRPKNPVALISRQEARRAGVRDIDLLVSAGKYQQAHDQLMGLWRSADFIADLDIERLYRVLRLEGTADDCLVARPKVTLEGVGRNPVVALTAGGVNVLTGASNSVPGELTLHNIDQRHFSDEDFVDTEDSVKVSFLNSGAGLQVRGAESVAITPTGKRAVVCGSRQNSLLLSGAHPGVITVWEIPLSRGRSSFRLRERAVCSFVLEGHTDEVTCACITADGTGCLSGSSDKTLRFWDLESGTCRYTADHLSEVNAVAITPDGRRGLSGADDGTVKLWDLESQKCICILADHSAPLRAMAISADGKRGLSGSGGSTRKQFSDWQNSGFTKSALLANDTVLRLWDLERRECLAALPGHSADVLGVGLSQDGKRGISIARDQTMRVWDLERPRCICTVSLPSEVCSLAVTPDLCVASTGHIGGKVILWDLLWSLKFSDRKA